MELDIPTKTKDFDDSVLMDIPELAWFDDVLESLRLKGEDCLWDFSYVELFKAVTAEAKAMGLVGLWPHQ